MEHLGNKLIEINVTDSSLIVPGTGSDTGLFSTVTDSLSSTPFVITILLVLFVAVLMCLIAIVIARLSSSKISDFKFSRLSEILSKITIAATPVVIILSTVVMPIFNVTAVDERHLLNNTPISISIDKAKALSASDETALLLDKEATSHVDIYANLDNTLNNNLGTNILVSTTHINDSSSTTNLSTTEQLIFITGSVVAGDIENFNITVKITEDLPVGVYKGYLDFFGDYIQDESISITYWCRPEDGEYPPQLGDDILKGNDELGNKIIGKLVTYDLGQTFALLTPNEIGLYSGGCDTFAGEKTNWHNMVKVNLSSTSYYYYWPFDLIVGGPYYNDMATVATVPSQFTNPQPDASAESWYDECMLNWDDSCNTNTAFINWINNVYNPWRIVYENNWRSWVDNYYQNSNTLPVFDGMELFWTTIRD